MYCLSVRLVVSDVKCVRKFVRLMLLLWKIISHILTLKNVRTAVCVQKNVQRKSLCKYQGFSLRLNFLRGREMKRSVKTILKEAAALLWQDIKNIENCDFAHCSLFGIESHSISGQLYLGSNYWISLPGLWTYEGRNSTFKR